MSLMTPSEQYLHNLIMEKIENYEKVNTKNIDKIISNKIKEYGMIVTKNDAKEIVKAIMPEINELVSEIIKEHFRSLAKHILEKFNSKE